MHSKILDTSNNAIVTVTGDGALSMEAQSTLTLSSTGGVTLTSDTTATVSGQGDVVVKSEGGDLTLTGDTGVTIQSAAVTGATAGAVSIQAGESTTSGAHLTVTGGATTSASHTGGAVSITGGAVTGATADGGSVIMVGGAGTNTGGNVEIRPGDGSTDGKVLLKDGAGTTRVTVETDGSVTVAGDTTFSETVSMSKRFALAGVTTKSAGNTITWAAADFAVVIITSDSTVDSNTVSVTGTPVDGQVMCVINNDEQDTAGDIVVPTGDTKFAVYYSGTWYT